MSSLKVFLVDDDESVRESLTFLLETMDYQVQAFDSGEAFLEQVTPEQTGCVILDSRMPGLTGQAVHQKLKAQASLLAVVYLTGHGDVPMAVDALQDGAVDFLQKPIDAKKLVSAIEKAWQHSQQRAHNQQSRQAYAELTPREQEILQWVVQGKRNQQIADELCLAVRTVEVHKAKLMKKFNAKTVAELVMHYAKLEG
ncbi:MAG: response regulator transcription factor [Vibrio sp.]